MYDADPENVRVDGLTNRRHPPVALTIDTPEDLQTLRRTWAALDSVPRLVASRDQGVDNSWAGLDIRTVLTGEDSSGRQSFHDVIVPPGAGLPSHARSHGDTYWYVFSGNVDLTIGSVSERAGPGAFGYAPPDTTQAVVNTSLAPARLLMAHFPAGTDRAFGEAHALWKQCGEAAPERYFAVLEKYGFRFDLAGPQAHDAHTNAAVERLDYTIETLADLEDLREQWRRKPPTPQLVLGVEGQEGLDRGAVKGNVLVSGDEDGGRVVFMQGLVQPGHTAPTHHQPTEEECFFVVEGQVQLTCGSETALIGPGAFGFAPRHATHTFHNPGDRPVRMLSSNSPAGHERGFEMMVRERARPSSRFADLVTAHGWSMHHQVSPNGR